MAEDLFAFVPRQFLGLQVIEMPEGASVYMREVISTLNAKRPTYKERDALKVVEEPLKRLRAAPAEDQIAFVLEALAAMNSRKSVSLSLALRGVVSNLLRGGLPLNSLHAVRMIELVSDRWQRHLFPYKALLSS